MSCPTELAFTIYVDGELSGEELRAVDSHLIGCATCRARVLQLREESAVLAGALRDEPAPRPVPVAAIPSVPTGGLSIAVIASALGLAAIGAGADAWLVSQGSFDLAPWAIARRVFDLVLVLRARAPGLFELLVAIAATASVSALATFALSAVARRLGGAVAVVAIAWVVGPGVPAPTQALEVFQGSRVVAEGERVEGTLLGRGEVVTVQGVVAGDLWVAARTVTVAGHVQGNVWVFAEEFVLTGRIDGDLYAGAERSRIAGRVGGSAHLAGDQVLLASQAVIGRDVRLLADRARVEGRIARDATAGVEHLELAGWVGRNADVWVGALVVDERSRIVGNLRAALPRNDQPTGDLATSVQGEARILSHRDVHNEHYGHDYGDPAFYIMRVIRVCAAFLAGLLLYLLVPGIFQRRFATGRGFFHAAGFGLLGLLLTPPALLLIAATLVGLPIAIAGAFLFVAVLYGAGLLVAARIGAALLPPKAAGLRAFGLTLLVGLVVLAVVTSVPFLGPAVQVLALLAGLGLVVDALREWRRDASGLRAPVAAP